MNKDQTYYEILGIPESATPEQIKKRYRELVRVYHPDVAGNKAHAHAMFLQIGEAYETLSDTLARSSYDRALEAKRQEKRRKMEQAQRLRRSGNSRIGQSGIGVSPEQKKAAQQLVRSAQMAFIQGRLQTAITHCKNAIAIDPRSAKAHAVLGDIYRRRNKVELAIKHYSFALQFDPEDRDIERKLTEVLSTQIGNSTEDVSYSPNTSGYYIGRMNTVGWSLIAGLFVAIRMLPASQLIVQENAIRTTSAWNSWLLPIMALIGFLVGTVFAVNRWLGSPSQELFSIGRLVRGGGIPLGYIAFAVSFFSFWLTATIYLVVAGLRGDASRSVLRLVGATVGILLLGALLYQPKQQYNIMFWCGNLVFPCSVLGWYCGHVFNPIKRYGWSK